MILSRKEIPPGVPLTPRQCGDSGGILLLLWAFLPLASSVETGAARGRNRIPAIRAGQEDFTELEPCAARNRERHWQMTPLEHTAQRCFQGLNRKRRIAIWERKNRSLLQALRGDTKTTEVTVWH
jgi:hypothetical protein